MLRSSPLSLVAITALCLVACASPTTDDHAEDSTEALTSAVGDADGADGAAKSTVTYDGKLSVRGTAYAIELAITYSDVSTSKLVEENSGLKDVRVSVRKPHLTTRFAVRDHAGRVVAEKTQASTLDIGGARSAEVVRALKAGQPLLALSGGVVVAGLTADLGGVPVRFAADFYGTPDAKIQLFGVHATYRPLSAPRVVTHHLSTDPSSSIDSVAVTVDKGELSLAFPRSVSFSADVGDDDRATTGSLSNDVVVDLTAR